MHLSSSISVKYSAQQVWALFADPFFLPKWDRSVAEIIPTSNTKAVVGFTFDTIAPKRKGQKEGLRMSYRIIEHVPDSHTKILLEKSKMFKRAVWTMIIQPEDSGARITCNVDLSMRWKYFFMGPVLFFNRKALLVDLQYLSKAIEKHYTAN